MISNINLEEKSCTCYAGDLNTAIRQGYKKIEYYTKDGNVLVITVEERKDGPLTQIDIEFLDKIASYTNYRNNPRYINIRDKLIKLHTDIIPKD